jgi:tetratricopeptide (TPR) repeat protein
MMNKQSKICLHSMVGNEEKVIKRMLESCYRYIDYYVIQCNGTDDTEKIINDFFDEKGIVGLTYNIEWNYPGWNRDHALQVCLKSNHNCDWILRMDADEQLQVDEDFDWTILDDKGIQSWNITADSPGSFYFRTWLWNANLHWVFRHDRRHECILLPGCGETGEEFQRENLPRTFRHIITNDGETWVDQNKFLVDALELEKNQISQGLLLEDTYHFFYIGKSYNDCYGNPDFPLGYKHQVEFARRCIFYLEEYVKHAPHGEMAYYSQYLIGNAYKFCKEYEKAIFAYEESEKYCHSRNEHLCGLAEVYLELNDYENMFFYTSQLIQTHRTNPFPQLFFLIHNNAYHNTGDYVQYLHAIASEKLSNV